jgi:polysaccharide pyruvyl transferase WcaK-like protein
MIAPTKFRTTCKPTRIAIAGYYGCGNLGDDTVVAILISTLRKYYPNADLCGFSLNPGDTERRHGIRAYCLRNQEETRLPRKPVDAGTAPVKPPRLGSFRRVLKKWRLGFKCLKTVKYYLADLPATILRELLFLQRAHRRLRGFDFFIIPGSGPLTDWWRGPWTHPYTFLSLGLLARINGAKFIALSVGSERLKTWLGKTFCVRFLSLARYRSFRDRYSRDLMEQLGLEGPNPVFPDQGFALLDALRLPAHPTPQEQQTTEELVVGIIPVGKDVCVSEGEDGSWYDAYIDTLSRLLVFLVRSGKYRLAFCPTTAVQDAPFVKRIIDDIKACCPEVSLAGRIIADPVDSIEEFIGRMQLCDIIVASRFHGVVLPFALRKPVLAISYGRKIGDLMRAFGQAAFHREITEANVGDIIGMFGALEEKRHSIAEELAKVASQYRSSLKQQYEEVFGRSADRRHGQEKKVTRIGDKAPLARTVPARNS